MIFLWWENIWLLSARDHVNESRNVSHTLTLKEFIIFCFISFEKANTISPFSTELVLLPKQSLRIHY